MNGAINGSTRIDKHTRLANKIEDMRSLVDHAERIIARVEGPRPEKILKDPSPARPELTLLQVLDIGPDEMARLMDEVHSRLDYLEEILFS